MNEEGWYTDPYRLHEARWFSAGKPTSLVRDEGVTSHDAPPDSPYLDQPEAIPDESPQDGDDLRRADDDEVASYEAVEQIWEPFIESGD